MGAASSVARMGGRTRQLRAAGVLTPVTACSGNVSGAESQKLFLEAGADLVWGKPFPDFTDGSMQRDLSRLLARCDARRASPPEPAPASANIVSATRGAHVEQV